MISTKDVSARLRGLQDTFAGRCLHGFLRLSGIDRSLVIAAQAFTALVPLLMVVSSLSPGDQRDFLAETLIRRFGLEGTAATAVTGLFTRPDAATGSLSLVSVVLVLFSALSFTKRMQRMYQQAWDLPSLGVRGSLNAAVGLAALLLEIAVLALLRTLVRGLPLDRVLHVPLSMIAGVILWTSIPFLLLDRRVSWRRLLPAGALAAVATSAYSLATSIYMPGLIERYSLRYGLFGVTIALVGWLICIAFLLVASTVVGAELDRTHDRWARRLRQRLHLESAAQRSSRAEEAASRTGP